MAYNTVIKRFPDSDIIQIKTYSWEVNAEEIEPKAPDKNKVYDSIAEAQKRAYLSEQSSLRRTKNTVYDIARSNENGWEWFLTLTFNPDKVDSYNYEKVCKKLSNYLHHIRRKDKDMIWLGVPERHKSGRYHFHFLIGNCPNLEQTFVDSGHRTKSGSIIYNVGSYRLGFTTVTRIENKERCVSYICKYLTKDLYEHTKNKKRYWVSKNVLRPDIEKLSLDLEMYDFEADCEYHKHIEVPSIEQSMDIYEIRVDSAKM